MEWKGRGVTVTTKLSWSPLPRLCSTFPFSACKFSFDIERKAHFVFSIPTSHTHPHYMFAVFQLNLWRKAQTLPFLLIKSCPKPAANPSQYSRETTPLAEYLRKFDKSLLIYQVCFNTHAQIVPWQLVHRIDAMWLYFGLTNILTWMNKHIATPLGLLVQVLTATPPNECFREDKTFLCT